MAQRTEILTFDDLTGEQIEKGQGETLKFSFDGRSFSIDLTEENAKAFREAIKPYLDAAQPTGTVGTSGRSSRTSTSSRQDKGYLQSVRAWANAKGIDINARGRIKKEVLDQYEAEHAA